VNEDWVRNWSHHVEKQALKIAHSKSAFQLTPLKNEASLKSKRWVEKELGREQSHILVGGLGTRLCSRDRYALQLLENVLGGQSGRLFIELREKQSLAYTVNSVHFEGIETGYVATYLACSPEKQKIALKGISEVLEKLALRGPNDLELKRAQKYYLGRHAMSLQSDSVIALYYGLKTLYQVPIFSEDQLMRKIQSIERSEIQRVCEKYFVQPYQVTSIVG